MKKMIVVIGLTLLLCPVATCLSASHSVKLDWGASATPGVTYDVYRGTTPGGEGSTPINTSAITGLTFTDNSPGTSACWVVKAKLGGLWSDPSNEVCVTYPSAPGTLTASPM